MNTVVSLSHLLCPLPLRFRNAWGLSVGGGPVPWGPAYYATSFGIHEECSKLCFSGGGRDEFYNVAQGVDGAVEVDWCIVAGTHPMK